MIYKCKNAFRKRKWDRVKRERQGGFKRTEEIRKCQGRRAAAAAMQKGRRRNVMQPQPSSSILVEMAAERRPRTQSVFGKDYLRLKKRNTI